MNKHILLVMKWLADKDSVSQDEREKNKNEACVAAHAAYADGADGACAIADAAYIAAHAAARTAACTAYWVDRYFRRTGEDKDEYEKELEK